DASRNSSKPNCNQVRNCSTTTSMDLSRDLTRVETKQLQRERAAAYCCWAHRFLQFLAFLQDSCAGRRQAYFIWHLSWKPSWASLTMVATVFSASWPSASLTTSCR